MKDPQLGSCPMCGCRWPHDADHELRGFGWLTDLSRGVTPSDIDAIIHDDTHGRPRFLVLEAKTTAEWTRLQTGQMRLWRGLARLPGVQVRVLVGDLNSILSYQVTRNGLSEPKLVTPEEVRAGVSRWLG